MKNKKQATISILLIVAIVVVVNLLASNIFYRADFTADQQYTISDSTKKILKNLEQPLTIKFYVSEGLPPRAQPIKRDIKDLLSEYSRYGRGNVEMLTLYPEKSQEIEDDAKALGIKKVRINVVGENKAEVQEIYMGIALFYGEKKEVLPVVMSTDNLEYLMTSSILKLTQKERKKIVFLSKQPDLSQLNPQMRQQLMAQMPPSHSVKTDTRIVGGMLNELYDVTELKLKKGEMIPQDSAMVVLNDIDTLSEWEKYAVDQYVMNGGRLTILTSSYAPGKEMFAQEKKVNYLDMLSTYGIQVNKNMVMDEYNYSVTIPQGMFRYSVPYPLWLKIVPEQLGVSLPDAIKNIGSLGMMYASSLTSKSVDGVTSKPIITTSSKSWTAEGMISLDPKQIEAPQESQLSSRDLALLSRGSFTSAYSAANLPDGADQRTFVPQAKDGATILTISSGSFLLDQTVSNFHDNATFFVNLVDYLTNSNELIAIRSRGSGISFISSKINDTQKEMIKWVGTLLMPLLVILYGMIRMFIRNRKTGRR